MCAMMRSVEEKHNMAPVLISDHQQTTTQKRQGKATQEVLIESVPFNNTEVDSTPGSH